MSQELHNETERNTIETKLAIPAQLDAIISEVQKDIMTEELSEFSNIKENDVNISTVYVFDDGEDIEAKVYFRNGLNREINFEYVPLVLINSNNEILASKTFDLREMGNIPSCGATPWKLFFEKSSIDMTKFSQGDCKVVFDPKIKAVNYAEIIYESFPEALELFKPAFEDFLDNLPKLEKGNFSISTFNITLQEDAQVIITLVIRNAAVNNAKLEVLPITVQDENGNVIASGKFELGDFIISPMKARICNVSFPTSLNIEEVVSIDKWRVLFQ